MKLPTLKPRLAVQGGSLPVMQDGGWRTDKMSSSARGYSYRWQQARLRFLRAHPLCQCPACDEGRVRLLAATVVDHKTPHRGDEVLFWDKSNWQALAKVCHDSWKAKQESKEGLR